MKDLIIGAADNYEWRHVRVWATSIKQSGFAGDVVLLAYRVTEELVRNCEALGIYVLQVNHDETGASINHRLGNINTQSHKLRNFHIWQYLSDNDPYRMVAITDTRDIYFQSNPKVFFDNHQEHDIYFPSECIEIQHEAWNSSMIGHLFGPFILDAIKHSTTCNSGTLFGKGDAIKKLMLNMYLIAKNFSATGSDQPTMNVIKELFPPQNCKVLGMDAGWACQCGVVLDPEKAHYIPLLLEPQPIIKDKMVYNNEGTLFCIVHQWDRIPELKSIVAERYAV